ncbi:nicotinate-nucleotide--dimethylbenzimidazole phosphoribosyltransferase [Streptomyces sp. PKU-EA00015]|uniref:nicotinate-nucleotide--dimethylbenzimidazole phosphoribosyltransferase n=1 Tax=Streptomyces sp. PKU-EA00015 TaxID=2748326 RepID=UPI0015A45A59|nr:nicotinate-nucleotide--dimethylbenzimidazole phosphoribosyltransferase [Streptomyces sp. PKU-EA00015]NWF31197.1 nicotinate-nucleotide--dimethylbenzimidazole phosphoribosyltransferase [Streptomyces sp. PKU-EA00015]
MTDTGQIPGEGLPENAGMVEQPGVPAPGAYTYLEPSEHTSEEDDLLLMPGAQGAWSDPQQVPTAQAPQAHGAPAADQYAAAPVSVQPMDRQVAAAQHGSGAYQVDYPAAGYGTHEYPVPGAPQPVGQEAAPEPEFVEVTPAPVADAAAYAQGAQRHDSQAQLPQEQPAFQEAEPQQTAPAQAQDAPAQDVHALGAEGAPLPGAPLPGAPSQPAFQEGLSQEPLAQVQGTMSVVPGVAPGDHMPEVAHGAHAAPAGAAAHTPAMVDPPAPAGEAAHAAPQEAVAAPAPEYAAPAQQAPHETGAHETGAHETGAHETGAHETGAHEAGGRHSGSVDLGAVRMPAAATSAMPTPPPARRPLHMGPPVPEPNNGVVRSLADRGPAGTPPHPMVLRPAPAQAAATGVEYLDVPGEEHAAGLPGPQLADIPPQPGAPWDPQPPHEPAQHASAAPAETVVPEAVAEQVTAQPDAGAETVEGAEESVNVTVQEATVPAPRVGGSEPPQPGETAAEAVEAVTETTAEDRAPESTEPAAEAGVEEPVAQATQNAEPSEAAEAEPVTAPEPAAAETEQVAAAEAPAAQAESVGAHEAEASPEPADSSAEAAPEVAAQAAPEQATEQVPAPEDTPAPQNAETEVPGVGTAEAIAADAGAGVAEGHLEPAAAEGHPEPAAENAPQADATPGTAEPVAAEGEPATPTAAPEADAVTAPAPGYDDAEREAVLRVMRERRDIRNGFRSDPIPHEVLLRVLEAAHTAPSVGHSQPWDFVVIRSAETRRTMHELAQRQREAYAKSLPKGRAKQFKELKIEAILDTPVNIVVTADPTRGGRHTLGRHTQPQMAPYSSALAVENLWLAARAEGLGVGWVSFFDEREMVRTLGLPEHLEVVAYLCVGYVDEFPEEPELMQAGWSRRRPLSWVVHEETYGRRALPGEEPHDLLQETVTNIRPLDAKALGEAWERQKRMTKPAGALGMLEIISAQLSGLSRMCPPPIPEPAAVAIFAGDHGVHAQGVTAWPQEVTGQMVANFLGGGAVCNAFATQVGAEVCVIDVGVASDLPATPGLLPRKVRPGTADFTTGPALTRDEVVAAIEVGIETARDLVAAGNKALLTGEMGIANTTTSAALIAVYTDADPAEITGRGTGINDEMHARKVDVVRRALELHQPDPADPIGVLSAVGGLEHCALVGLILGGASLRTPVVLDGVSTGAAALVARAIAPEALAACIAGHRSAEPGHVAALNKLGLRPLVDLDLRLGEGTGALLALPVVQSAARAMHEVATFDSAGVTEK